MTVQYSKLNDPNEIRLLTLSPGNHADNIELLLWHTSLSLPLSSHPPGLSPRMALDDLQATLPAGWTAAETEQDKYRFLFEETSTENSTWIHPDPRCKPELWRPLSELPPEGFEPAFEALSYSWELEDDAEPVVVWYDRQSRHGDPMTEGHVTISLRRNLTSALRHLRYSDRKRTLWVDAICINQDDDLEKGTQVKNMWLLYRLASRVIVWLGPKSQDSANAMSTLEYLGRQLEVSRSNVRYRSPNATEPEWFRAVCPLPYDDETWTAINAFFSRSWFERLWIWQEIQLSNSSAVVVCGKSEILWQCLRRAIICLVSKQELPSISLRKRLDATYPLADERGSSSLNLLLNTSRQRVVSNQKDKIYGILSMCGPRLARQIDPHYSTSHSIGDIYKDFFLKYLSLVDRLELLSGCDSTVKRIETPSWVPDWSLPRRTWPLSGFTNASGTSCSHTRYLDPGILKVVGCQATTVSRASEPAPMENAHILKAVTQWNPKTLYTDKYVTGGTLLDAYCTTLRAGYLAERWPTIGAPSLQDWEKQFMELSSQCYSNEPVTSDLETDADFHWFCKIVRGRRLIETHEGHIGLGPPGAMPGDVVCVFLGCKVPLLLRPVSSSLTSPYRVIGECYVHGLDDNVVILGPFPEHIKVQLDKSSSGYDAVHTYINVRTGKRSDDDPRMPMLSQTEWERLPRRTRLPDDPANMENFRSRLSGEVVNHDPRLLPSSLQPKLGKSLRVFSLV